MKYTSFPLQHRINWQMKERQKEGPLHCWGTDQKADLGTFQGWGLRVELVQNNLSPAPPWTCEVVGNTLVPMPSSPHSGENKSHREQPHSCHARFLAVVTPGDSQWRTLVISALGGEHEFISLLSPSLASSSCTHHGRLALDSL